MANNCFYQMTIIGTKENCKAWLKKMQSYDEKNHFFRIFDAHVFDEYSMPGGNKYRMDISGDCAWSLATCCMASGYSNGQDLFAINTRDLRLKMEAYSEECGMGFSEHYVYDNGECLVNECVDFDEIFWDKNEFATYDEFKKDYIESYVATPPAESEFDEDGWCRIGGFDWDDSVL